MDTKRSSLIRKLLNTQHLNVPERKELGPFPSFREVKEVVEEHFKEFSFLPGTVTKWERDTFCYEGFILEKTTGSGVPYILHCLDFRGSVDANYLRLDYALISYLQRAYNNKIDGIPILFDS